MEFGIEKSAIPIMEKRKGEKKTQKEYICSVRKASVHLGKKKIIRTKKVFRNWMISQKEVASITRIFQLQRRIYWCCKFFVVVVKKMLVLWVFYSCSDEDAGVVSVLQL